MQLALIYSVTVLWNFQYNIIFMLSKRKIKPLIIFSLTSWCWQKENKLLRVSGSIFVWSVISWTTVMIASQLEKKVQSALKSYRDLYFAILFSVFCSSLNCIRYSLRVATYETLIQYKTLRKTELCHFPRDTNIFCSHSQHKLRCFSFSTSEAEKILSCSLYHRATLLAH